MSSPISPHRELSPGYKVPLVNGPTSTTSDDDEQLGHHATIFCYCEAGETPEKLQVPIQGTFFSFAEEDNFLSKAVFLEVPFEIYDSLAQQFIPLPPTAYWRCPSSRNPFFITKDGRIEDQDCPRLQELIELLDANQEHDETGIRAQSSSPGLISPPPPAQPPRPRESPVNVEFSEKGVQTVEGLNPRKRMRSGSQLEAEAPATSTCNAAIELNLRIHDYGRGKISQKRGTGNSAVDPIII